jgi:hypothetical protein
MSHEDISAAEHILIGEGPLELPVPVVLEAYELFSRQIDFQLRRLIAQWSYAASPLARAMLGNAWGQTQGQRAPLGSFGNIG